MSVDGLPLHYSYETCGVLNPYDIPPHEQTLRAHKKLRISYPGDSGSGYTILTKPDGEKAGSVVEFVEQYILREYGIAWEVVPVSAASTAFSPQSSYTACVHEIVLGGTDLCVGNFWPTFERRSLGGTFTNALYMDQFRVVAFVAEQAASFSNLTEAWKPVLSA